ncbi:hypothetical protein MCO_01218 [Bartonella sp. DB5-6]|uniref:hypothetical protein n=1 Tax=Bartonella sp. DB5-6 TaxID=1094755 RepID=UPI00026E9E77|nr:hypothetical protein [Bartonella sp. DB5-6]EJF77487.1 hypothetical protein MCO_01218 [Bartonella sp. DB5-6]
MNTKSHIIEQVKHEKPSFFVVEKKEKMGTPTEVRMSDIAKKLRSVHAQMRMKHSPRRLTLQSSVDESLKSYLDDISRAILAEHYIRRQKEKKLFEHLEQIKMLVQSLHREKKSLEQAAVTRHMSRSKSFDSVVQHLAHMACEESLECSSPQKAQNFSEQNRTTSIQTNVENTLQQENRSSSPIEGMKPCSKEAEELVGNSIIEERHPTVQTSGHYIENDQYSSLKAESLGISFFLRYPFKKLLLCFLIIAFMAAITLCFHVFLKGVHFFNFMMLG